MKLFLVGYMACGKTHWGKLKAAELGIRFIDLDSYIVCRVRQSISEIFEKSGEEAFRKMERYYLEEICDLYEDFVLATGGGTPCYDDNMDYMNQKGYTIFLNTDIHIITERLKIGKRKRPLIAHLSDDEIFDFVNRHLHERMPYYLKAHEEIKH